MTCVKATKLAGRTTLHSRVLLGCCALIPKILALHASGADHYDVTVERDLELKTRDGVTLRADVCRPKADGKFPVLLTRTPYDKNGVLGFCQKAAAHGYVVVAQDVRGRYSSEGDWYPFKFESQDGYDTVEWAAGLPYANGKVGMFGGSYVGATQFLAAIAQPPHLAGICPNYTASNYYNGWTYQGGAFEQWLNESWTSSLAFDTLGRLAENASSSDDWKHKLPLLSYPVLKMPSSEALAPYFIDWLHHPNYDDYWRRWSIEDHYSRIQVPVFQHGRVV